MAEVLPMRFWDKVKIVASGCWEWQGTLSRGYGDFYVRQQKTAKAHRLTYNYFKGEIPQGLEIDHLCRNKRCVNPDHLEVVTRSVNTLRGLLPQIMRAKRKSHCQRGHPFNKGNIYINPRGRRECIACRGLAVKRHKDRRKEYVTG